ncbi:MAG: fenitrothion hydrolase [Actinomycetia bacterium]|nr:fenitrothion hydrolase [Actinomycetes bacterium]
MTGWNRTSLRTLALVALAAAVIALALPASASAHALGGRADLPIPVWLFGWTAVIVLVISFVALGALWKRPQLERGEVRPLPRRLNAVLTSRALEVLLGAAGIALLGAMLWSGFAGRQSATNNFSPTFVFIIFWLGLVPASVLLGNVFSALNPWRSLGRAASWAIDRIFRGQAPAAPPYPTWLGHLPAAAGLAAFTWLELIAVGGQLPRSVAAAALVYTCVTLIGMAVYGVDAWIERAETFSLYYGLMARIAPFERRGNQIVLRRPLSGLARLTPHPGFILFVAVMLGGVSFDGLQEGSVWAVIGPLIEDGVDSVFGIMGARLFADSVGLAAMVAIIYCVFLLGAAAIRHALRGKVAPAPSNPALQSSRGLSTLFAHSLVPIAVAYVGAHYLTLLILEGQGVASLISDPLGHGWDLFGTSSLGIDFGLIGAKNSWYTQVAMVVAGHVAALMLAHDRAVSLFGDSRAATRSQIGMLAIMVALTSFALWLLNNANA